LGGDVFEYKGFKNNGLSTTNADLAKDIGLMKVTGNARDLAKFKITSLRNIELTAPYMHDGRIATLEAVLDHYNSPTLFQNPGIDSTLAITTNSRFGSSLMLTAEEKRKIIVFMKTFTDSTFIKNPAYSNPF
jgi:cytochrome c peroxidase